jgi:hypothetical protein
MAIGTPPNWWTTTTDQTVTLTLNRDLALLLCGAAPYHAGEYAEARNHSMAAAHYELQEKLREALEKNRER